MPTMTVQQAEQISIAVEIATVAHRHQVDKCGDAYILHPLRVMARVRSPEEKMIAVLHDVIEDCGLTTDDLVGRGIPTDVAEGVKTLSRLEIQGKPEPYINGFIHRIANCGDLRIVRVKRADLRDNRDPRRIPPNAVAHHSLIKKYARADTILAAVLRVDRLTKELKKAQELV